MVFPSGRSSKPRARKTRNSVSQLPPRGARPPPKKAGIRQLEVQRRDGAESGANPKIFRRRAEGVQPFGLGPQQASAMRWPPPVRFLPDFQIGDGPRRRRADWR